MCAAAIMVALSMAGSRADEAFNAELFTDLGTPVKRNACYNHILGTDAQGNERYFQAYKGDPWFLLSIDPMTGETEQYTAERVGNPYGIWWARNKQLYIVTGGSGRDDVYRFDPADEQLHYMGHPTEAEHVVWMLCEGEDGTLYGGTYPDARLVAIDPATNQVRDLGRIPPTQKYIRFVDSKGPYVYCSVGPVKPEVWAYHTGTGEKTEILPESLREKLSWGNAQKRADGEVYIYAGEEVYRVDGVSVRPVEQLPPALPHNHQGRPDRQVLVMRDGTRITADRQTGTERRYFVQRPGEQRRAVECSYEGTKTHLWALESGPDGSIYGTTRSPITLFRIDPASDGVEVLGDPIGRNGQVYSWVWHEGKLHMAAYGMSSVTVWDPKRPWQFGADAESNPRWVGSCHIGRPTSLIVAPDGKHLLAAGLPHYGRTGGVLTVIDVEQAEFEVVEGIVGEQSVMAMVTIPGTSLVCLGTTYHGGSAADEQYSDARLVLWDFDKRRAEFETVAAPGEGTIQQMVRAGDRVFGTTADEGRLFVFDIPTRTIVHNAALGFGPGSLFGLRYRQADGMLYAISGDSIMRINPETFASERLGTYPGMDYGMAISGDSIYVCAEANLVKFAIPDAGE